MAAKAIMLSPGCHAICKIFRLKSKHSTLISSFFLLPVVVIFFCLRSCFGRIFSRDASKHNPDFNSRLNIRKKLLYDPVSTDLNKKMKQKLVAIKYLFYLHLGLVWINPEFNFVHIGICNF